MKISKWFLFGCMVAAFQFSGCSNGEGDSDNAQNGDNSGNENPGTDDPGTDDPGTDDPGTDEPDDKPVCGDGKVEGGETCDDGGKDNGDGCSSECEVEPGYVCDASGCELTCGNGKPNEGEACDDGNRASGDGCSSECEVEPGYVCDASGCELACGNGKENEGETCDDGNRASGDGCSSKCKIEAGYLCPTFGAMCYEVPVESYCGDGIVDPASEVCDDGNDYSDDGCYECAVEAGWRCVTGDWGLSSCYRRACGDSIVDQEPELGFNEVCDHGRNNVAEDKAYGKDVCVAKTCVYAPYCGDGNVDEAFGEACDNGSDADGVSLNTATYNGCMADCTLAPYCGDGKVEPGIENCDDGGQIDGDGCSAKCMREEGWLCPAVGGACKELECGNGILAEGESCDDDNHTNGDGCDSNCRPEAGYKCIGFEVACTECVAKGVQCMKVSYGDGKLDVDGYEECDDGNLNNGDGCSSVGHVEPGYVCPTAGARCVAKTCGDSILAFGEECDDGNVTSGDGCSSRCKSEPNWRCPTPGKPCVKGTCGDGYVDAGEECDSGTANDTKSGCSSACKLEAGYECLSLGAYSDKSLAACKKITCGDGKILVTDGYSTYEQCDLGSTLGGTTGCSTDCRVMAGYHCITEDDGSMTCHEGVCGDGHVDVGEQCDDHNLKAGDGCDPSCKIEAVFEQTADGSYRPICGDGITVWDAGEECDDGNLASGDGCSSQCKREAGYACTEYSNELPPTIKLNVTHRDFRGYYSVHNSEINRFCKSSSDASPVDGCITNAMVSAYRDNFRAKAGHPDFERINASYVNNPVNQNAGVTAYRLGADGVPEFFQSGSTGITKNSFQMWYRDFPGINKTIKKQLTLNKQSDGSYQYYSSAFFPIDNEGYGNESNNHNFHFTSHIQTYFKYRGNNEKLTFNGDDDVFVYVNGVKAIDLGGCHSATSASFTLTGKEQTKVVDGTTYKYKYNGTYDLYENGIYSINFYQAERKTDGSNFQLTLAGFMDMGTTTCSSICGDGLIVGDEECDYGSASTADWELYGCDKTTCQNKPKCGNGRIESGEFCDNGNLCAGNASAACTGITVKTDAACINCEYASCGNGTKEAYEECDPKDATHAGLAAGQRCLSTCKISRCGDGYVDADAGEKCDDGNTNNNDACTTKCDVPSCGDGIVSDYLGEVCDDGENTGDYGTCGLGCAYLAPYCGDGKVEPGKEDCDLGKDKNDGSYNGCTSECKFFGCGDGVIQTEFGEECDNGASNGTDNKCDNTCLKVSIIY